MGLFDSNNETTRQLLARNKGMQQQQWQRIQAMRDEEQRRLAMQNQLAGQVGSYFGRKAGHDEEYNLAQAHDEKMAAYEAEQASIFAQGGRREAQPPTNVVSPHGGISTQQPAPQTPRTEGERFQAMGKQLFDQAAQEGNKDGMAMAMQYMKFGQNASNQAASKAAGQKAARTANINANNLYKSGYDDLAQAVEGGMDVKDALVEARARNKAKVEAKKDRPTKANKFITNKNGSVSVYDNDGKVVKQIADPEAAEKDKKRNNALMTKLAQTDAVMDNISDMRVLGIKENAAGTAYGAFKNVPNTDSYRLANKIETVKASLTFDQLQEMRDLSEDGSSGLGQVAVVEINLLGAKVANLDPAAGPEAFEAQLKDIESHYDNIRNISLGKPATVNWDDPAYKDNVKKLKGKRYFKDASGQWHEV